MVESEFGSAPKGTGPLFCSVIEKSGRARFYEKTDESVLGAYLAPSSS